MDKFPELIGPATLPPLAALILYILWHRWQDIKAAGSRLYGDAVENISDSREFRQALIGERQKFELLQSSWQSDKLSTLLEEDASFIREVVYQELRQIGPMKKEIEQLREMVRILAQEMSKQNRDRRSADND